MRVSSNELFSTLKNITVIPNASEDLNQLSDSLLRCGFILLDLEEQFSSVILCSSVQMW